MYLFDNKEPKTIKLSSTCPTISAVVSPLRSNSPRFLKTIKDNSWVDHSLVTCLNLASMSFSFKAEIQTSSMSSLFGNKGASKISFRQYPGLSRSKVNPVICWILCQCLYFMALFDINSRIGQISLKSSMVFFKEWNAGHSFRALGNFLHLFWNSISSLLISSILTSAHGILWYLLTLSITSLYSLYNLCNKFNSFLILFNSGCSECGKPKRSSPIV